MLKILFSILLLVAPGLSSYSYDLSPSRGDGFVGYRALYCGLFKKETLNFVDETGVYSTKNIFKLGRVNLIPSRKSELRYFYDSLSQLQEGQFYQVMLELRGEEIAKLRTFGENLVVQITEPLRGPLLDQSRCHPASYR